MARPEPHNPVTQFKPVKIARLDGCLYALAGGAWLACNHAEIMQDIGVMGDVLFRDYWGVVCYDDGCPLSVNLNANIVKEFE